MPFNWPPNCSACFFLPLRPSMDPQHSSQSDPLKVTLSMSLLCCVSPIGENMRPPRQTLRRLNLL